MAETELVYIMKEKIMKLFCPGSAWVCGLVARQHFSTFPPKSLPAVNFLVFGLQGETPRPNIDRPANVMGPLWISKPPSLSLKLVNSPTCLFAAGHPKQNVKRKAAPQPRAEVRGQTDRSNAQQAQSSDFQLVSVWGQNMREEPCKYPVYHFRFCTGLAAESPFTFTSCV